ncbi:fungal-specific transcription factor domain-containing protein [Aspergillus pseudoustus]|uniref:Fungal-specific transcription factor domain-containing protein n=1 Tax=Aspergillus pseudoustus TaxID=1810923 RepID=A0ABR4J6K7_9EURO
MASSNPSDTVSQPVTGGLELSPYRQEEPCTPTNSENRRKYPKVSRACDPCKSKKIRCSGTLPCHTCSRRRLSCTYDTKYSRGRPPTPLSRLGQTPNRATPRSQVNEEQTDGPRAVSGLVIEGQYFDLTSGLGFLHRAWTKLSAQRSQLLSPGSNEADRNQLLESAGDRPFHLDRQDIEALPADTTARGLVSFYFDSCVVTYRMLHRQTVEGWLDAMLNNRAQGHSLTISLGNARASIIFTILAIATFRNSRLHGTLSNDLQLAGLRESDPRFYSATRLTESETGFPRVESVQARLIQVLYLLQTGRMSKAWYTFGHAYQIISSLGLHRKQSRKQNALREPSEYITQQCAKRVFWTAYTIDKYLSVVFGRPRLMQDIEIDQEFPDNVNDEDMSPNGPLRVDGRDECHVASLICHAKIARLIGQISHQVYYVGDGRQADRAAAADALIRELKSWHADLPPHLGTVKPSTLIPIFRRQATAISLAYCHALIHVTRPFLLGDGNTFSGEPEMQARISECLSAARQALEIVERIVNDSELSHSFWWTQYVLFCALAVIYVWEIQRRARHDPAGTDRSHEALFEFAEKCRPHLLTTDSGGPSNYRYSLILDELQHEAYQQGLPSYDPRGMAEVDQSAEDELDGRIGAWGEQPLTNVSHELDVSTNDILFSGASMLESWQTTDWLDLDSSAFYPLLNMSNFTRSVARDLGAGSPPYPI